LSAASFQFSHPIPRFSSDLLGCPLSKMESIIFYQHSSAHTMGPFQSSSQTAAVLPTTQKIIPQQNSFFKQRIVADPIAHQSLLDIDCIDVVKATATPSSAPFPPGPSTCTLGLSLRIVENAVAGRDYEELPELDDLISAGNHLRTCAQCAHKQSCSSLRANLRCDCAKDA
jgi:hypothetical protein